MFWVRVSVKIDIATRFMWMPGIRPVIVPARMPKRREATSGNIGIDGRRGC